jgi:DNA-directed RNA polymerase subunit beta
VASAKPRPKRQRRNFSHLEKTAAARILEVPNLIDIQRASFRQFMETGIREVIKDISPIEDYTGTLAVEFGDHVFEPPAVTERECRETDKSFESGLFMTVAFVNKETGEIREQRVFMGNFPQMTDAGTFIINGTERVVVTQLVRSPGAYIMEPKDPAKQVFTANLMPQRGSWLELEIDKKGQVFARIDRKRKLPVTTLLRALPEVDATTGEIYDTHSVPRSRDGRAEPLHRLHAREGPGQDARPGADRGLQEAASGRAADDRQLAEVVRHPLL